MFFSSDPHRETWSWHSFWHTIWKYIWQYMAYLFWLSDILSGRYFDILSDILSGIYSDVLSGISSDILSGILSAISSKILCGRGPAGTTLILGLLFGSGRDHCDHELAVEVRRRRRRPADMKSNNPHLTGGEIRVSLEKSWSHGVFQPFLEISGCQRVDPLRLGQLQCLLRHMELIGGQLQLRLSRGVGVFGFIQGNQK